MFFVDLTFALSGSQNRHVEYYIQHLCLSSHSIVINTAVNEPLILYVYTI